MRRTYAIRLKVTRNQDELLKSVLAQFCELYNMALEQRRDAWKTCRKRLTRFSQHAELKDLRAAFPEYREGSADLQRDPINRVDLAFNAFFRRVAKGEKPGYPRFKSAERYKSFDVQSANFWIEGDAIRVSKLGTFRFKTRCRMRGRPVNLHIERRAGRWQAHIVCDLGYPPPKVVVENPIGIDVGLTTLATLSDGTEIENPRWFTQEADNLARANRSLERKRRGSKNRAKAKEARRRIYRRIVGRRHDYLHQVSRWLVDNYDLIAYEKLRIAKMGQSNLAKSIFDAAWGELIHQITYKAEEAGRYAVAVDPRGTTINCSACGERVPKELKERRHDCPSCGLSLGRDHNAAVNILKRGERFALTAGGTV
jgi:putative transposase